MLDNKEKYHQRLEEGLCTQCGIAVPDGGDLCAAHASKKRKRQASWVAGEREQRRANHLCIWCPKTRPTKVPPGESSCLACRIKRRRPLSTRSGIAQNLGIGGEAPPSGRKRYRGQGKRGQQPRAKLDKQDLRSVREMLTAAEGGLDMLNTPSVQAMGLVGREAIEQAACSQLALAVRYLQVVLERHPSLEKVRTLEYRSGGKLNGPVVIRGPRKK